MVRTVKEVAEEFGVSVASISAKLKKKGLKKIAGMYQIDEDTYRWLKARRGQVGRPWNTDIYSISYSGDQEV